MAIQGRTLWYYGVEVILYETTKRGVVINVEGIEHKAVASAIEAIKEAYRSLCSDEVIKKAEESAPSTSADPSAARAAWSAPAIRLGSSAIWWARSRP